MASVHRLVGKWLDRGRAVRFPGPICREA